MLFSQQIFINFLVHKALMGSLSLYALAKEKILGGKLWTAWHRFIVIASFSNMYVVLMGK